MSSNPLGLGYTSWPHYSSIQILEVDASTVPEKSIFSCAEAPIHANGVGMFQNPF